MRFVQAVVPMPVQEKVVMWVLSESSESVIVGAFAEGARVGDEDPVFFGRFSFMMLEDAFGEMRAEAERRGYAVVQP